MTSWQQYEPRPEPTPEPSPAPSPEPAPAPSPAPEPEPPHAHQPTSRPSLRASDADRDKVATLLSHAYAEGRLTHEEHDERLGMAMTARTFDDLVPLTSDLVPLDRPLTSATPAQRADAKFPAVDPAGASGEIDTITTIFGETKRFQQWRVRKHTNATMFFGEAKLDMREAIFDDTVIDLGGFFCFSDVKIIVPEGVNIRDETSSVFGSLSIKGLRPHEGGPVITLRGALVLSELSVRGPDFKPWWKLRSGKPTDGRP